MSNVNAALIENLSPFFLKRKEKVTAALVYHVLPLMMPNLVAIWGMNENADSLVWDSSSQGRHMAINGTTTFNNHGELTRMMELSGSGYLSRASEAAFETGGAFSIMAWVRKDVAATQFCILTKSVNFTAASNSSFHFVIGGADNLNLSIVNGSTSTSHTYSAPIGEIVFAGCSYDPGNAINLYLGTKADGLIEDSNTTSIPASRNAASSTTVAIGATDGGANQSDGLFGKIAYANSVTPAAFFRTYFEYTKALFF